MRRRLDGVLELDVDVGKIFVRGADVSTVLELLSRALGAKFVGHGMTLGGLVIGVWRNPDAGRNVITDDGSIDGVRHEPQNLVEVKDDAVGRGWSWPKDGDVVHHRGVTRVPGVYFLGLSWHNTRGSALLGLVNDDAVYPQSGGGFGVDDLWMVEDEGGDVVVDDGVK